MVIIDTIKTTYQELFTIRLSHPAFEKIIAYKDPVTHVVTSIIGSSIFEVLSIEADTDTRKFFADHGMSHKCSNNMIICYVRTASAKPYISFPPVVQIRFLLHAQPGFLRSTDAEFLGVEEVYQFTNVGRAGDATNRFLTANATGVETADKKPVGVVKAEKNCFAVIDILTDVMDVNYRVFDGGNLASPEYRILFISK